MSYRITASSDHQVIECLKCGGSSEDPRDVRLRSCPKCGYHAIFPAGMMGGLLGGGRSSLLLDPSELVVGEAEESQE